MDVAHFNSLGHWAAPPTSLLLLAIAGVFGLGGLGQPSAALGSHAALRVGIQISAGRPAPSRCSRRSRRPASTRAASARSISRAFLLRLKRSRTSVRVIPSRRSCAGEARRDRRSSLGRSRPGARSGELRTFVLGPGFVVDRVLRPFQGRMDHDARIRHARTRMAGCSRARSASMKRALPPGSAVDDVVAIQHVIGGRSSAERITGLR